MFWFTKPQRTVASNTWQANGMLKNVKKPDGSVVEFEYDALGRRTAKIHKEKVTRFVWDGNVLLHEWNYEQKKRPRLSLDSKGEFVTGEEETENPVTWVYEDGSFVPSAKIINDETFSIISDYIGRPVQAYNQKGEKVWETNYDIYGRLRNLQGDKKFIPFRQLGQYEDEELEGLYYNRFRYYDCNIGGYISQDLIGLEGNNPNFYAYVYNSNEQIDLFGQTYTPGPRSNNLFGQDNPHRRIKNVSEWRRPIKRSDFKQLRDDFLGKDHVKVDKGKWRSIDGKRQFRVKPDDYLGKHGMGSPEVPNQRHAHLEFLEENTNGRIKVKKNVHLPIVDDPRLPNIECK